MARAESDGAAENPLAVEDESDNGRRIAAVRKRITSSFVMALMAKAVGTMSTFFPIFLAITRAGGDAAELVNGTCTC